MMSQLERKLPKPESVKQLIDSADSKRLMNLMNEQSGGSLETIARQAMKGDGTQLLGLIQSVLATQEGGELAKRLGAELK